MTYQKRYYLIRFPATNLAKIRPSSKKLQTQTTDHRWNDGPTMEQRTVYLCRVLSDTNLFRGVLVFPTSF